MRTRGSAGARLSVTLLTEMECARLNRFSDAGAAMERLACFTRSGAGHIAGQGHEGNMSCSHEFERRGAVEGHDGARAHQRGDRAYMLTVAALMAHLAETLGRLWHASTRVVVTIHR
jgi:hypothetical protein